MLKHLDAPAVLPRAAEPTLCPTGSQVLLVADNSKRAQREVRIQAAGDDNVLVLWSAPGKSKLRDGWQLTNVC